MASKNRTILVFIDWYAPGFQAGGPVRSVVNMTETMTDHQFKVITRNTDYMSDTPYDLPTNAWHRLSPNTEVRYMPEAEVNADSISRIINETEFDVGYVNGVYSKLFSILPTKLLKKSGKPTVVAARGMLSPNAIAIKAAKKKLFLNVSKLTGLYKGVTFHATNQDEKAHILSVFPGACVKVAANFPRRFDHSDTRTRAGMVKLVSVSRIAREKNTKYALELLQDVKSDIALDLYGAVYDEGYWAECTSVIEQLPENVSVTHHGSLDSDQVEEVLRDSDALLFPTKGENFGHVIYEALSCGLPVIISDKTPWHAVTDQQCGWEISLDDPAGFVSKIEELAQMDDAAYETMSRNAIQLAASFIDEKLLNDNKALFQ